MNGKTKTMGATSKIAHTDNTERSVAIAMRQVRPVFSSVQIDKEVPSRAIRVPEEWPVRTQKMATRRLLPVSWSAQLSEWIQIVRWMIADQIDGPCAEQDTRRRNGNNPLQVLPKKKAARSGRLKFGG